MKLDDIIDQVSNLKVPDICVQKLTLENIDIDLLKSILLKYGFLILNVHSIEDFSFLDIISKFSKFGIPHTHNDTEKIVWDIKLGGTTGVEELARSHGMDEFTFHTDCSYEYDTPSHFALNVIQHDQKNGGWNLLVSNQSIINNLSYESLSTLMNKKYEVKIPPEFYKGQDKEEIYLIDRDFNIQYRKDIIIRDALDITMAKALDELEEIIFNPINMRKLFIEKGHILLLDNKVFLHSRTKIKDNSRHLQRIRFNFNNPIYTKRSL